MKPLEHQVEGIDWLCDRPYALLADEPGLGKTMQQLRAAVEPVLAIAPAMILDSGTWDDEIEEWTPGLDVKQVAYTSVVERARDRAGRMTRPTAQLRKDLRQHWGTVILDESHYIKTPGRNAAYWTKALAKLRADRIRQSTGTPMPNWAHEAFNLLRFAYPEDARPGERLGSRWRWVREWFQITEATWLPGSPKQIGDLRPDRTWEQFREANWGDRFLLRTRDECLDLPPLTIQPFHVHMKKEQARVYRQLKKDYVAWLEDGTEIAAWNQAAQVIKLWKAATGLELFGGKGSAKLDALRGLLEDRPRPTFVVGFFRDTVRECARVAEEVGAEARMLTGDSSRRDRKEIARAFKSGNLPVLCATIDLVREGLNFQAADQVIRVERSWVPSRNDQVRDRLWRMGQTRPVLVIDLITECAMELGQLRLVQSKTDQQIKALGAADLRTLA